MDPNNPMNNPVPAMPPVNSPVPPMPAAVAPTPMQQTPPPQTLPLQTPPSPQPAPVANTPVIPTSTNAQEQIISSSPKKGGFGKFIVILILLVLLIAGGLGGYYYYINYMIKPAADVIPENTSEQSTDTEPLPVAVGEISGNPETENYQDETYGFSVDYLSSWDFECVSCNTVPVENTTDTWTILQMQTFDYQLNEEDKILSGAYLTVKARSTNNGALSIEELVGDTTSGFSMSEFNGISGALNLDPSKPFQGFIFDAGEYDIELSWKSGTAKDRADQELQTILKSFKQI